MRDPTSRQRGRPQNDKDRKHQNTFAQEVNIVPNMDTARGIRGGWKVGGAEEVCLVSIRELERH
jgi:hypothetical protein